MEEKKPILSLKDIMKVYPGVIALNKVSIDFYPGEVHALIGENGAGKSTFIEDHHRRPRPRRRHHHHRRRDVQCDEPRAGPPARH